MEHRHMDHLEHMNHMDNTQIMRLIDGISLYADAGKTEDDIS